MKVTILLILINILVYLAIQKGRLVVENLAVSYHAVFRRHEYYRLLSAGFTHQELTHLFCNMLSLANIGEMMEAYFGSFYFLLVYLGSLLFGSLLSLLIHYSRNDSYTYSIGASGAICGLIGSYYLLIFYALGLQGLSALARPIISLFIMSIMPGVDGTAHFTGLVVGAFLCFLFLIF